MNEKIHRISIDSKNKSPEAAILNEKYFVDVEVSQVYTIKYDFSDDELQRIADSLSNPVVHNTRVNKPIEKKFDYALELGYLPGVTDNVANTTTQIVNDLLKIDIGLSKIFSSKTLFISGNISIEKVAEIAKDQINVLIERFHIKTYDQYLADFGMDKIVPVVNIEEEPKVIQVDLNMSNEELLLMGKDGILDPDTNKRRGPLALDEDYLNAIKEYYLKQGRNPTDIEIESLAQTWSEHCKHTYFAAQIDEINSVYKTYIQKATNDIRKMLGEKDFCVSVFKDNSGGIVFDENYIITDKVETHNSPSALDPFGGAITGIVGVNRDCVGFGLGAKPIANRYGFCVGRPDDTNKIYKSVGNEALSPKKILEGVVEGVNVGGNCSGIPTPQGFVYFDDSYKGKPLIFVGTIGLMPRKLRGKPLHEKKAQPGDNIVMIGGRVGKDGIHGATFSSVALDEGSPATAVQIGDPITQKKFSDAIIKEARDLELYTSITDNGAGGISCSVAEMAEESGGFIVDLEKVPLKYPGLQPWETWISESQERMTLSIPDEKIDEFQVLMKNRGIESTVIGRFNDTDKAVVRYNGEDILNLDMEFLHDGLPKRTFTTEAYIYDNVEPNIEVESQEELFDKLLCAHNNCGFEYISRQYDHEVQNNSVIKPLIGKGEVNGTASVIKPLFDSDKGVVLSQGLYPRLSEINCYDMAACAIDTALRNAVAVGGNINHIAILDNFCWCSSNEPKRLAQLKDTAKACYDYAVLYKAPFISGKDSMFNDFKGLDENGEPIKISALPTILVSSIGVIEDVEKTTTMDFKVKDDLIYVIGITRDECGGSEFYHAYKEIGSKSPKVDALNARQLYEKMYELNKIQLLSSCNSIGAGGLGIALAKSSISGQLGLDVDISKVLVSEEMPAQKILYSETQSRFIVTINPKDKQVFEESVDSFGISLIGKVDNGFKIKYNGDVIIDKTLAQITKKYKERFA